MRLTLLFVLALTCGCTRTPPGPNYSDVDETMMSQIEERASHHGTRVYWMNPPRKSTSSGTAGGS